MASPSDRTDLLSALLQNYGQDPSPRLRSAIRYLLHGDPEHLEEDTADLLVVEGFQADSVWCKVARQVLADEQAEWRIPPSELAQCVPPIQRESFGLKPMSSEAVESLLADNPHLLQGEQLSSNERCFLLRALRHSDLWMKLALHQSSSGQLVELVEGRAYLVSDYSLPEQMQNLVDLIQVPDDAVLRDLYMKRLQMWGPEAAISVALHQDDTGNYYDVIMDAMAVLWSEKPQLPASIRDGLRQRSWLPLQSDATRFVRPCDVVHVPILADLITRLAADPDLQGRFVHSADLADSVKNSAGYQCLTDALLSTLTKSGLQLLGETLRGSSNYRIGQVLESGDRLVELPVFIELFSGTDDIPPAHSVLIQVYNKLGESRAQDISHYMAGRMPKEQIIQCLEVLATKHASSSVSVRRVSLAVHSRYLEDLVGCEDFTSSDLLGLRLRNQRGDWKACESLSVETGISSEYSLAATG